MLTVGYGSADGHLLGHVKQQAPVILVNPAKQPAEIEEVAGFLAPGTEGDLVRSLALRQVRELRGLFTVVKQLIQRDFQGAGELFQRFHRWNGMAVLNAGD